jgi:alanine racemase
MVFAVIKADAYGHGAVEVAKQLAQQGVDGLCVALPEEGIELRQAGLRLPILVLGGTYSIGAMDTVAYGLTPVVNDLDQVARIHEASRGRRAKVHLKVDTGMSRLGISLRELPRFLWQMRRFTSVEVDGVMSHLASAESDEGYTTDQLRAFHLALHEVRKAGLRPSLVHMANSAGVLRFPSTHFNLVRPGLALYGVSPIASLGAELEPVMSVRTEVVQLRKLHEGDRVSYGGTFVARRPTNLAVLPMGYADGVSHRMSNSGPVLIRGQRALLVGAVCMDMCMIDVTDVEGASVGDEVVLLGRQGNEQINASELAQIQGCVPHEVLTSVSRRVPRFYRR